MNWLDPNYLFASLLWGSVGVAYCIYGKRQRAIAPFCGGVLMIVVSYFVGNVVLMSLLCLGLMVAVYYLAKRDF